MWKTQLVSDVRRPRFGGAGDSGTAGLSLADRFRRHADALVRHGRSPLCARLMYDAAGDLDAGGVTARLFAGVPAPSGSVPQLRLLAALHYLVLAGRAPRLAAFYPSAAGTLPPDKVWQVALPTLEQHFDWVKQRLHGPVQTNEPGRSAVLFAGLLWVAARHEHPIRLLEIGASGGLNLIPDRYCYVVDGKELGDAGSPVRFNEPWQPPPTVDVHAAARKLTIVSRAGCDRMPLDPTASEDRLTLLSYIWPDETERIERLKAALELVAAAPAPIQRQCASAWLERVLGTGGDGELTVIWQSVFRQYVDAEEWTAIEDTIGRAATRDPTLTWLSMEPGDDHLADMRLVCRTGYPHHECVLASCGDHGPPVIWNERPQRSPAVAEQRASVGAQPASRAGEHGC